MKSIFYILKRFTLRLLKPRIYVTHHYSNYEEYVNFQKKKTTDPQKIEKWLGEEWQVKLDGFKILFEKHKSILNPGSKAVCLGSRTGQEVLALQEMGLDAIGIDLVEFLPYTKKGDVHNLEFESQSIDFVFSNIFDHVLNPQMFVDEIERILKPSGYALLHLQLALRGDLYTELRLASSKPIIKLFKQSVLVKDEYIKNTFDSMDEELLFEKI